MVRVLFIHPDLGIGGAERLVVDAAIALQQRGHTVSFLTNHHDPTHCFEETRNGQLTVQTVGDWMPRSLFGKFAAVCAYLRMIYASLYTAFVLSNDERFDVIVCDQISLGIPLLHLCAHQPKILFYCHFPDQLLAKQGSWLKRLYRLPLNYLEEITTGSADSVLVNSKFTRRVFKQTFRSISLMPAVLYPSLMTQHFDATEPLPDSQLSRQLKFADDHIVYLSINRYERKKNLGLALRAFKQLESLLGRAQFERCVLVMAGGYDRRVAENVEHFAELHELAEQLGLADRVRFLRSPSDAQKVHLLRSCAALVYTPPNEHFGIVPVEAMYMRRPVVALNSGGPTETVIHETTGYLCEDDAAEFAQAMARFAGDRTLSERMGERGRKRVQQKFSYEAFGEQLDCIIVQLTDTKKAN